MSRFLFLAIAFLAASTAFATTATITWTAPTTYVDPANPGVEKPLPAGTLTYKLLQSTDTAPDYRQVGQTDQLKATRVIGTGKTCFKVTALFTPATADGNTWADSDQSKDACVVVTPSAGPRSTVPPANVNAVITTP